MVQLAGGPLFGRFGDIFGGQAAMTLAFMAAALSYGLLGLSYTLPILFISRLPSVFMHAMQGTVYILVKCKECSVCQCSSSPRVANSSFDSNSN